MPAYLFCRRVLIALFVVMAPLSQAAARGTPDSFADLADKLLPTVVSIATSQTLKQSAGQQGLPKIPPGSPLADLFKDFLAPQKSAPRHVTSLGTGFIIDPSGVIVTNNHVIEDAEHITATLNDGTVLQAKLIGRDEKTDLALLKVTSKKPLPAAKFGNSDHARVGDWVVAIGNPFGLGSTVTAGIISARNRDIQAGPYDEFIQTDAPINRGNSGGPLFDMDGNVVGVNSAIYSPSGGSVGIGFSIPSNLVRDVVAQLRAHGTLQRGWIGVRIQAVTNDIAEGLGLPSATGALITDVTPKGPAAKAGIANGDLVTAFDGKAIGDSRALPRIVADTPIGKTVSVDILRKGKKQTVRLTVLKLADDKPMRAPAPQKSAPAPKPKTQSRLTGLGLSLAPIDNDARAQFKIAGNIQGVLVTDVTPDSAAWEKNIRSGDVIVQVAGQNVHSPADVTRHIEADAKAGKKIELMLVNRGGDLAYIALKLG
ncbi:MAG TPA: DegQ family serine endoprotease [Rhizomicrobium sp.]|jgi:serine protease Do|nr:DegQ family serine endoprotease [Rhizomicrobium sp.]